MENLLEIKNIDVIKDILKVFVISIGVFYTAVKIDNKENNYKNKIIALITLFNLPLISVILKEFFEVFNNMICIVLLEIIIYKFYSKNKIGYSTLIVILATSINYILFFISAIFGFIPKKVLGIESRGVELIIITIIYYIILEAFLRIKKLKHGLSFLKHRINNEQIEILVLNISTTILFTTVLFSKGNLKLAKSLVFTLIIFGIIMFITIQKSLQLYYKQKLLSKELEETKAELSKKEKEVADLEAENIEISKKSHTLAHKQKSLEYKLEEIINKTEISKDEVGEVRDRIKALEKDLYKEKTTIELDKTEIPQIDDMLKYMQSECKKNKIDFELQIKGNIHYMTNNLITKDNLETLLADHIKNAIIAINHTDNVNRSIFVRLGEIDGIYSLYIYDTGIEFEKDTLENLGNKPSTTHKDEGGTGMGFMNTFDTLRKCNASLIIEQIGKPSKDNYTKTIIIKFDKKNEFKIM